MCSCDYSDGHSEFETIMTPKARKQYRCLECGLPIVPGEKYERRSGKFDGQMYSYKTHQTCADAADQGDGCISVPGEVLNDLRECHHPKKHSCRNAWARLLWRFRHTHKSHARNLMINRRWLDEVKED